MAGSIKKLELGADRHDRTEFFEELAAAGITTPPVRLIGNVVVQLSGTATNIVAVVEHCTRDPGSDEANWAPAEDNSFTGDLSAGIAVRPYVEPAVGYWRVRVSALTGGNVKVSIIGERA